MILVLLGGPGFRARPSGRRPRPKPHPPRTLQNAFFFSSFFRCLFGSISKRSWLGFPPPFASQNLPKSVQNRCQEALYVGFQICFVFFPIFTPNLDPQIPEKSLFFLWKNHFFLKNGLLKLTPILGRFWKPTCLQNRAQIHQNLEKIDSQDPFKF